MLVKRTSGPLSALALARAAHDEAAARMLRAARYHLREAAKLDRQLEEVPDEHPAEEDAGFAR